MVVGAWAVALSDGGSIESRLLKNYIVQMGTKTIFRYIYNLCNLRNTSNVTITVTQKLLLVNV